MEGEGKNDKTSGEARREIAKSYLLSE